jgi:hypothetical protein
VPHIIVVWCTDPPPAGPITLNRNRTLSVPLGDYLPERPGFEDWSLHFDPVEQFWFVGFYPFLRLPDGKVKWPDGRVDRFAAAESYRKYEQVTKEDAQAYARRFGKDLPFAPSPVMAPPGPPAIDFEALENALLEKGRSTQAALVRFMADKKTADAEDIAVKVHGNSRVGDKAIGKNARQTSDFLAAMGSRLSFRFASGWMIRRIADE